MPPDQCVRGQVIEKSASIWFVLWAIASLVFVGPGPAHSEETGIVEMARLPSAMTYAHLEVDAERRRLFEIGDSPQGMKVISYNLDSMNQTGSLLVPQSHSGFGGKLSAVDPGGHRLFVLYPHSVPGPNRLVFGIVVIDTVTFQVLHQRVLPELAPAVPVDRSSGNQIGIKAMSFFSDPDPAEERIYVVSEIPAGQGDLSISNNSVFITEIDVTKLMSSASSPIVWRYQLPQCAMAMARESPSIVFRSTSRPEIFLPCRAGGMPGLFAQPLVTPGIAGVAIVPGATPEDTSRFQSSFFPISGNLQWGIAAVDPVNERFFMQVDGSTTEAVVWVFDVARSAWLGAIVLPSGYASGRSTGLAIDVKLGRMYAVSALLTEPTTHVKVVVSSTKARSADQGQIVSAEVAGSPIRGRVVSDPLRHRLFSPMGGGYLVLEDRIPPSIPSAAPDPDANTIDVDESAETAANFSGGAHGYGARIRWIGGIRGIERNSNTIIENVPYPAYPSQGTRDIHLARVMSATLNNGEATAKATAAERDRDNTDNDLTYVTESLKGIGGPDLTPNRWPYETVACTDFGGPGDIQSDSADGAHVGCGKNAGIVSAVTFNQVNIPRESLLISDAWSRVLITKEPVRGVVSVSESEVRGLEVPGVFGIGRVSSRAESWAAGRPGSARGKFDRFIEDVWISSEAGQQIPVCTTKCDPETVKDALNRAMGVRGSVEFPRPDQNKISGSPRGYEALVIRDGAERANERSVNQEADENRLEVPAMVVTIFADGRVSSRIVISLAATATESHYGIYLMRGEGGTSLTEAIEQAFESFEEFDRRVGLGQFERIGNGVGAAGGAAVQVIKRTYKGMRFFLASPSHAVRVGGLWLFLAAPLLLLMRRGITVRRP